MPPVLARLSLLMVGLALLVAQPGEARADATQLCRSVSSIALAPTDVLLSPYIAGHDIWYGMMEWDDPLALQIGSAVPGYAYLIGMQVGGAIIRVISGIFEFPMGLASLFREGSQGALNRAQDETYAVYSNDFGPCPVRIGSSYNTINY